jgi:Flp pilus assembly secretin CpaC
MHSINPIEGTKIDANHANQGRLGALFRGQATGKEARFMRSILTPHLTRKPPMPIQPPRWRKRLESDRRPAYLMMAELIAEDIQRGDLTTWSNRSRPHHSRVCEERR